jgi:hypothetical protein
VETIWVADLRISAATAEKISTKHGLSEQDVRDAVVGVRWLSFVWHDHPERGRRAIVEAFVRGQRVLVVLYPKPRDAYGDAWDLGSAYPTGD